MIKTGIVTKYDNHFGTIESDTKEQYILKDDEIVDGGRLKVLDKVQFVAETKDYEDGSYNMARFVKKISSGASSVNSSNSKFKRL